MFFFWGGAGKAAVKVANILPSNDSCHKLGTAIFFGAKEKERQNVGHIEYSQSSFVARKEILRIQLGVSTNLQIGSPIDYPQA